MAEQIVKTIQRKALSGFDTPVPIGTDGNYVQMKSKLDLEEQLKVGGNKITAIRKINKNSSYYYQVIEWYASKPITIDTTTNLPQQEDRSYITHTVQTNIYSETLYEEYNIITPDILVERELTNNGQNEIILIKNVEFDDYSFVLISNIFDRYMSYNMLNPDAEQYSPQYLLHQKYISVSNQGD